MYLCIGFLFFCKFVFFCLFYKCIGRYVLNFIFKQICFNLIHGRWSLEGICFYIFVFLSFFCNSLFVISIFHRKNIFLIDPLHCWPGNWTGCIQLFLHPKWWHFTQETASSFHRHHHHRRTEQTDVKTGKSLNCQELIVW